MLIKLPNGLIESGGKELFDYVDIDELRGKQQNYLADKELVVGNIGHIPKILEDMILSIQTKEGIQWKGDIAKAIYQLPVTDLETILIKVRENTYGNRYYFQADCPECDTKTKNLRLDLDSLKIKKMSLKKMVEPKVIHLPKSDVNIELKPLYLDDLFKSLKVAKNKQNSLVTSLIVLTVKKFGDKDSITEEDIENLPASDMVHMNKCLDKMQLTGEIDTDVEIKCTNSKCEAEFVSKLNPFDPDFFDPSRGSAN